MNVFEANRPAWLDKWLDYPHTVLSVSEARELTGYVVSLEEYIANLKKIAKDAPYL